MFFIIMARKETRQQFAAIPSLIKNRKVPLWNWFAGLCGAMVVFSEGASASALGVATFQTALISALLLSGLLCDRFGAGCNMVIVTHLSDGSLWDRQAFPDTTILEIRPRKRLKYAGDGGNSGGLLSFTSAHTDAWRQQGYEDTMLAMEHIRKPLAARQALTRSEAVLQKSLDITEEADLALRNAMARIK